MQQKLFSRQQGFVNSQQDLAYLPDQTGGFIVKNRNDLGAGIKKVLDDQRGYYLIGYRPDESTFNPKTGGRGYHKLTIKVVGRPGLKVRHRVGFYGFTEHELSSKVTTRGQQLIEAISSPFASEGVALRLTSLFGNDPKIGSFVRSMLYVDGSSLTFTEEADGWHQAVFDVLAVTFGDYGQIVDQISKSHTLRVRGATYQNVLKNGLEYQIVLPTKKAGAYQLRAALRDSASSRVGSANQFIEVPDINKGRLLLSGLVLSGVDAGSSKALSIPGSIDSDVTSLPTDTNTSQLVDPQAGPAVRKIRAGMRLHYSFLAYNAKVDKTTLRPKLQTQVRLFRDGRLLFAGKTTPLNIDNTKDLKRIAAGGVLAITSEIKPGEYVLQVIVTDFLAQEKTRTATQWIDFAVVE